MAHGWVAAKEGCYQFRTASIWFIRFQRDLPLSAKYAEAGGVTLLLILWLLRRRFQKYRYGERAMKWYQNKKSRILNWWEGVVNKVAETSSLLALLLPHIMYILVVVGMKRLVPSLVTYLATKTYMISVISLWRPLYQTFCVIGQINYNVSSLNVKEDPKDTTKQSEKLLAPSEVKDQQKHKQQLNEHMKHALDLLKYWVVYAILFAMFGTARLLPVIRSILPVDENSKSTKSWGLFGSKKVKPGFMSRLRLSSTFVEEVRLVFFIWLLLMPASLLRTDDVNSTIRITKKSKSNRPLDALYNIVSPAVVSIMKSSAFLSGKVEGSSYGAKAIQFLQSLLSVLVMTRVLNEKTKELIIKTILESTALLPAAVTVMMPSYFTSYGIIYVSLVVPAGYSVEACNSAAKSTSSVETIVCKMDAVSRYLQFWAISAVISTILCWFQPVLAWVPLSTHAIWLLWAFVQMNSPTRRIFRIIEEELVVFGLLKSHGKEQKENKQLNDTFLFRSVAKVIATLPSNVDTEDKAELVNAKHSPHEKQE